MPITPSFQLEQTNTLVRLHIRVPHVRVSADTLHVVLTDDSKVLHVSSPPYLLVLNFGPHHRFRPDDGQPDLPDGDCLSSSWKTNHSDNNNNEQEENVSSAKTEEETCRAIYQPHVQDGVILLELVKSQWHQGHWENLDLLGRLVAPRCATIHSRHATTTNDSRTGTPTPPTTSRWLREIVDDCAHEAHSAHEKNGTANHSTIQEQQQDNGLYGFARLFEGVFLDLARDGLAKEMLEQPWTADDERRQRMLNHSYRHWQQQQICSVETTTADEEVPSWMAVSDHLLQTENTNAEDDDLAEKSVYDQRRRKRHMVESEKFCPDHYLGDKLENEMVQEDYIYQCAMAMQPHWTEEPGVGDGRDETVEESSSAKDIAFTPEEQSTLVSIPYPLLPSWVLQPQSRHLTDNDPIVAISSKTSTFTTLSANLLDLLFAYVYDHIVTDGDPTVESAWTVSTLSASLSWLDDWVDDDYASMVTATATENQEAPSPQKVRTRTIVQCVIVSSLRRALVYPYLRQIDFGLYVWKNVATVCRRGLRTVLRCLLQMRHVLECSESYYLGNKLWVDPYMAWLQQQQQSTDSMSLERDVIVPLGLAIECVLAEWEAAPDRCKETLGLGLIELEASMMAGDDDSSSSSSNDGTSSSDSSDDDDNCSNSNSEGSTQSESCAIGPVNGELTSHNTAAAVELSKELSNMRLEPTRSSPLELFSIASPIDNTTAERGNSGKAKSRKAREQKAASLIEEFGENIS